jgi:hypothetical protein
MPQHAPVRRRTAPIHPRRVSGPVRVAPAGYALPPRTGVFERIRALPDRRVVDRLLRGRLCIWVIGVMLGGIVAMQVSLLRLNAGISRAVIASQTLERQNYDLQAAISREQSDGRIADAAKANNMIDPDVGETVWLPARPGEDAALAVKHMKPPSQQAIDVMANFGKVPGVFNVVGATSGAGSVTPAATSTPAAQSTATAAATPTPAATPVPTATPVVTPAPTVVQSTVGGATAPQG